MNTIIYKVVEGYEDEIVYKNGNLKEVSNGGILKIKIAEGKGIDIEVPLQAAGRPVVQETKKKAKEKEEVKDEKIEEEKVIRKLVRKHLKIDEVKFGKETTIEKNTLTIREDICKDAIATEELVKDMKIDIITPKDYDQYSNTIMDVQPIATKEEGELGEGITRVIDGVVVMVTGTDEKGVQIGEFGSSEGRLERNIMWGRPGSPDKGDIFIKTDITVKDGTGMERPGPMAAHKATDVVVQEIREALKEADEDLIADTDELVQKRRPG